MAKRVIHELIDDLDGKPAEETVQFSLDGVHYEIDLSAKNAARLRDALAPYVATGNKVGRATGGSLIRRQQTHRVPAASDPEQKRAIRNWATAKGLEVSSRGRISQEIVDRYHAEAGRRR